MSANKSPANSYGGSPLSAGKNPGANGWFLAGYMEQAPGLPKMPAPLI